MIYYVQLQIFQILDINLVSNIKNSLNQKMKINNYINLFMHRIYACIVKNLSIKKFLVKNLL